MIADTATGKYIQITPDTLRGVRKAYNEAVERGDEVFDYEGSPLLVGYANYLIQYMEMVLTGEDNG